MVNLTLRAKLNSLLASCLVLDRLDDELVSCNKLGHHLLEADECLVGVRDRGPIEIGLVAICRGRNLAIFVRCQAMTIVFIVTIHLVIDTIVAELGKHGHDWD